MSQPQFTLSWDAFQQNICNGLGTLQQNEEFVDMTIAADGHFVRVHQIVLSLASPYIKELIKSAQCRNPVIFLNKISYHTLCSILEYIYTGQTVVAKEHIDELIKGAQALHIRGLQEMDHLVSLSIKNANNQASYERNTSSEINTSTKYVKDRYTEIKNSDHEYIDDAIEFCDAERMDDTTDDTTNIETQSQIRERKKTKQMMVAVNKDPIKPTETPDSLQIQYCVSNQGSLQMILNRYLYYLRYSSKTGHRHWRCTDYIKKKCPAAVSTKDDIVLRRTSAHIHPFHDGKIAKKVRDNVVFSLISEAEQHGDLKKTKNHDDTS